jgi:hypothetical protein
MSKAGKVYKVRAKTYEKCYISYEFEKRKTTSDIVLYLNLRSRPWKNKIYKAMQKETIADSVRHIFSR